MQERYNNFALSKQKEDRNTVNKHIYKGVNMKKIMITLALIMMTTISQAQTLGECQQAAEKNYPKSMVATAHSISASNLSECCYGLARAYANDVSTDGAQYERAK